MYGGLNCSISSYTRDMCVQNCKNNTDYNTYLKCGMTSPALALISGEPEIAKCIIDTKKFIK